MKVRLDKRELAGGRLSYYLDIHAGGDRWHESVGIYHDPKKTKAENDAARRLAERKRVDREDELVESITKSRKDKLNRPFVDWYREVCDRDWRYGRKRRKVCESTKRSWRTLILWLRRWELAHDKLISFKMASDKKWIEDFRQWLMEHVTAGKLKQGSASLLFQKLVSGLEEARYEGILTVNPGRDVAAIPMPSDSTAVLEQWEVQKLVETPVNYAEVKRAFLFSAMFTGLRISDLYAMTYGNVKKTDHGYELVFVEWKKRNHEKVREFHLPMSNEAVRFLGSFKASDQPLFDLPAYSTVNRCLKKWATDAGIDKNITPHISRHTLGTLIYDTTKDLLAVKGILNHERSTTSERYTHVHNQKLRDVVNNLSTQSHISAEPGASNITEG